MDDLSRARRNYRAQKERLEGMTRARENALRRMEDCRRIVEQCDRRIPVVQRWVENARRQMDGFGDAARQKKLSAIAAIHEELRALGIEPPESSALKQAAEVAARIDSQPTEPPGPPQLVEANSVEDAIDKVVALGQAS